MKGVELMCKVNSTEMMRAIRNIALTEQLATPEALAAMTCGDVCDLIVKKYAVLIANDEEMWFIEHEALEKVRNRIRIAKV